MVKISAVIPVLNEEKRLEPCLQSLTSWVDEIVIVDNGSTDGTVALAERYGCRVLRFDGRHPYMGPHRAFGIAQATGEWLLQLDADERVPEPLGRKLRELAEARACCGVRVARKNIILGRWLKHGGMWRVDQLKLYRREGLDLNQPERMHWEPGLDGPILDLPRREEYSVIHVPFASADHVVRKFLSYADGEMKTLAAKGCRFSALRVVWRPMRRFGINYLYRRGFLDGVPGLLWAALLAMLEFLAEAKLYDLRDHGLAGPADVG